MWLRLAALGPHTCPTVPQGLPAGGHIQEVCLIELEGVALRSANESPEMLQMLIPWVWGTAQSLQVSAVPRVRPRLLSQRRAQSREWPEPSAWLDLPSLVAEAARSHRPPPRERPVPCSACVHRWGTRARVPGSDPCPQTNLQSLPHSGPQCPSLESES